MSNRPIPPWWILSIWVSGGVLFISKFTVSSLVLRNTRLEQAERHVRLSSAPTKKRKKEMSCKTRRSLEAESG